MCGHNVHENYFRNQFRGYAENKCDYLEQVIATHENIIQDMIVHHYIELPSVYNQSLSTLEQDNPCAEFLEYR